MVHRDVTLKVCSTTSASAQKTRNAKLTQTKKNVDRAMKTSKINFNGKANNVQKLFPFSMVFYANYQCSSMFIQCYKGGLAPNFSVLYKLINMNCNGKWDLINLRICLSYHMADFDKYSELAPIICSIFFCYKAFRTGEGRQCSKNATS